MFRIWEFNTDIMDWIELEELPDESYFNKSGRLVHWKYGEKDMPGYFIELSVKSAKIAWLQSDGLSQYIKGYIEKYNPDPRQ